MVPKCVHVVIKGFRIILPTNSLKCMVLSCDWGKHNKDNQWTNYKWYGSVSWCGLVLQIHSGCTDAYVPSLHTVDEILIRNGSMSSLIPSQVSSSVLEAETPAVCVRGRDFRLFCKMAWKPSVSCFVRLFNHLTNGTISPRYMFLFSSGLILPINTSCFPIEASPEGVWLTPGLQKCMFWILIKHAFYM